MTRLIKLLRFLVGPWLEPHLNEQRHQQIIMNQAELAAKLKDLEAQVKKVAAEQGAKSDALAAEIQKLKDIIAAGSEVTPEVTAQLDAVSAALQALDDTIPDTAEPS